MLVLSRQEASKREKPPGLSTGRLFRFGTLWALLAQPPGCGGIWPCRDLLALGSHTTAHHDDHRSPGMLDIALFSGEVHGVVPCGGAPCGTLMLYLYALGDIL